MHERCKHSLTLQCAHSRTHVQNGPSDVQGVADIVQIKLYTLRTRQEHMKALQHKVLGRIHLAALKNRTCKDKHQGGIDRL